MVNTANVSQYKAEITNDDLAFIGAALTCTSRLAHDKLNPERAMEVTRTANACVIGLREGTITTFHVEFINKSLDAVVHLLEQDDHVSKMQVEACRAQRDAIRQKLLRGIH